MIQNQEVLRGIFTISRIVAIVQILLMTPKVTDELWNVLGQWDVSLATDHLIVVQIWTTIQIQESFYCMVGQSKNFASNSINNYNAALVKVCTLMSAILVL